MKKEQKKYIISTNIDYADEFNYLVLSIFTDKERAYILNNIDDLPEDEEYYFGTNEYLNFSKEEIIKLLQEAKRIKKEEIEVLKKFNIGGSSLDIVDSLTDRIRYKEDYE